MTEHPSSRGMTLRYPRTFHGATMRLIDPWRPADAFTVTEKTLDVDDDCPMHVGFVAACPKMYDLDGHGDAPIECTLEWPHGHVLLECEDGSSVITAPVASRAMVEEILHAMEAARQFPPEAAAIRTVLTRDTAHPPGELTTVERQYLAIPGNRLSLQPRRWFS